MDEKILLAVLASSGLWSVVIKLLDYWITGTKKNSAEREALGALLRHEMFDIYEIYRNEEEIPADIAEEMESLHAAYHLLGFNHTGDRIHEDLAKKPIRRV